MGALGATLRKKNERKRAKTGGSVWGSTSVGNARTCIRTLDRGCVATKRSPVDLRPATDSSRRELSETEAFHVGRVTGSNFIAR